MIMKERKKAPIWTAKLQEGPFYHSTGSNSMTVRNPPTTGTCLDDRVAETALGITSKMQGSGAYPKKVDSSDTTC